MNHLQKFTSQIRNRLLLLFVCNNALVLGGWWFLDSYPYLSFEPIEILAVLSVGSLLITIGLAWFGAKLVTQPMQLIWQAILHIAPDTESTPAPDTRRITVGRELTTYLISHIYQLASTAETIEKIAKNSHPDLKTDFVANSLPLPMVILDKNMNVVFANEALLRYTARTAEDTEQQNLYLVMDMLFSNEHTFDAWLEDVRNNTVTATRTWERVRLNVGDQKATKLFDLVAYYNRSNPNGFEIMLVLFDRTRQYAQDEQTISFLALAVHELRTPLTLLRGYIDVFEEELEGKLDAELTGYLQKMKATAQQLSAFIGNVQNVSRYENDQLTLNLREEQWEPLLRAAVDDVALRAQVRGIHFNLDITKDLPSVGVDSSGIYEVINNLLDNAIKYSKPDSEVVIRSYLTKDGAVETVIQDHGVGMPESAIGSVFDKFYRDYRNRGQVGGTGMGLYLAKAIMTAHGGTLWVRSKEGQGSSFGFTLTPYAKLSSDKRSNGPDLKRSAHGWIKNHSMYRR